MSGKYRAVTSNRRSSISVLLVIMLTFTGIVSLQSASTATTPAVSSVSPESGSAAGGNIITITGQSLTSATAVRIDGVNVAAFTIVSDTSISATVPTRADSLRTIGRKDLTVQMSDGSTASGQVYYTYRPTLIATAASGLPMLQLGDLASRTQAKPITRSSQAPFTVTGTDSVTNASYNYVTDSNKSNWVSANEPGWQNEGHEVGLARWPNTSHGLTGSIILNANASSVGGASSGFINLRSSGSCVTSNIVSFGSPSQSYDSYCSVFGPEVYSEAFYGEAGQSLAFNWAAADNGDDYEIYAYLVAVSDSSTIPAPSTSNHTLLVHSSGALQTLKTSSGDISASGLYRFRFVNGTYDATGGKVLGSNMYVDPMISVGLANLITIPSLGDQIGSSGSSTVLVTSTAGGQVTVTASGTSNCTVSSTTPHTTVTISWSQLGSCVLTANQGATGAYAAASAVSRGFDIRASATVPNAPTITSLTNGAGSLSIGLTPPNRDGGAALSNYEYSLDNGVTWITPSPPSTTPPIIVSGLSEGTTYQVMTRAVNSVGVSTASNMMSTNLTGGGSGGSNSSGTSYSPKLTHLSTLPVAPRTNTARVSMFGTYFDTVTEVLVDGKKVEIIRKGRNELVLRLPGGLSGFVDVQIKSTIGALSLPRHFNFGGRANANRAELIVGGFGHNSRVLTPSMRQGIERWLARHPDLKTVTCTGFTSLPRRTTDVALSTNRGTTACDFAKSKRPDLVPSVTQGVEDPRLGSNVRRVRLVLTK